MYIKFLSFIFFAVFSVNANDAGIQCVKENQYSSCSRDQTVQERISDYLKLISAGNAYAARQFLQDGEAIEISKKSRDFLYLKSQSYALVDLEDLINYRWDNGNFNKLSVALEQRMYKDSVLSSIGIGYEPEKLLNWIGKYQVSFSEDQKNVIKKAIREWNTVFGNIETKTIEWNQAEDSVSKNQWEYLTIKNRNSYLLKLMERDPAFLIYKDDDVEAMSVSISSAEVKAMMDKAINSGTLSANDIMELQAARNDDFRLLQLSKIFDGSNKVFTKEEILKITANRRVKMQYGIKPSDFERMSMLLSHSVTQELKGTKTGDYVLEYGPVVIKLGNVPETYSKLNKDGTVTVDLTLIGKFLQINGYTAESLLSGEQSKERISELAKYISPLAIYEGMHRRQRKYALDHKMYKPNTQESEIAAISFEALYFNEKISRDEVFYAIYDQTKAYLEFSAVIVNEATDFNMDFFSFNKKMKYKNKNVLSEDATVAKMLYAVNEEIHNCDNEKNNLTNQERVLEIKHIFNFSLDYFISKITEIRCEDLEKILNYYSNEYDKKFYRESKQIILEYYSLL